MREPVSAQTFKHRAHEGKSDRDAACSLSVSGLELDFYQKKKKEEKKGKNSDWQKVFVGMMTESSAKGASF